MSKGRKTRKRPFLLLALCFILLFFLPGSCDATLLDVVVNLRNADAVDPALLPPSALASSVMDNSDLFVAVCSPGTFSPDDGGVCHECQGCHVEQFETLPCLPYRDRGCANCTVCDEHEVEVCQCSVKTSQCFTGDRVCLKLKPTTVTLTVELFSASLLNSRQEQLVAAGLATGFVDWLVEEFATPSVDFVAMVGTGPRAYAATFTFHDIYNQTTIMRLKAPNPLLYQRGLVYTFGGTVSRRRRSLLAYTSGLVSATGSHSDCLTNTTCDGPYLAFQFFNESGCGGTCVGVPCPPGLFGGFGNCAGCTPGSYADAVGMTVCTPCPDGYSSPPAANASDLCFVPPTTPGPTTSTTGATTTIYLTTSGATAATTAPVPTSSTTATTAPVPTSSTTTSVPVVPVTTSTPVVPVTTSTPVVPVTTAAAVVPVTTAAPVVPVTTAASGGTGSGYNGNQNHNEHSDSSANTNTNNNVFHIQIPPVDWNTKAPPVYSNVINLMVPPLPRGYSVQYAPDGPDVSGPVYLMGGPFVLLLVFLCCYTLAVSCCLSPMDDYYYGPRGTVIPYRLLPPPPPDDRANRYADRV